MSEHKASVVITHKAGLHARPAVAFTKLAKTFEASITTKDSETLAWVDAKSVAKVMGLKVKSGRTLEILAKGSDAKEAVDALSGLIARNFDEG